MPPSPREKSVNPATARAGPAAGSTTKRGGGAARGSPNSERPPRSRIPALPCGPRGAAPSRTVPPPPGWTLPLPSGGGCLLSPQPASLHRLARPAPGSGGWEGGPGHGLAPVVVAGLRTSCAGEGWMSPSAPPPLGAPRFFLPTPASPGIYRGRR